MFEVYEFNAKGSTLKSYFVMDTFHDVPVLKDNNGSMYQFISLERAERLAKLLEDNNGLIPENSEI